nr:immunoglobulin light chain junction region [Macaca mulatta]MOW58511.1 immunoglobulin light chain junction region [Macaca mulatta]MOW60381.1 immunoglobulin light chain junction region [Macaca mulatta]
DYYCQSYDTSGYQVF